MLEIDEKKFESSKSQLFKLLKYSVSSVFYSVIAAALSGAIWPVYGILLIISIEDLQNVDVDILKKKGFWDAIYFAILGATAAIGILFQK